MVVIIAVSKREPKWREKYFQSWPGGIFLSGLNKTITDEDVSEIGADPENVPAARRLSLMLSTTTSNLDTAPTKLPDWPQNK